MTKTIRTFFMVLLFSLIAVCVSASLAYADTTINVSPKPGSDLGKAVSDKLDKAHKKATAKNKYIIKVKPGSYKLGRTLHMYSNTTLDLTDVKIKGTNKSKNFILIGSSTNGKTDKAKGYAYKNIRIIGGDLNRNWGSATTILLGHAKNVTVEGTTLHNSTNGHLIEAAGINGLKIRNCAFYNQKHTKKAKKPTPEAIQLDILVKDHMKQYKPQVLNLKNVLIENCSFTNVPRGVGSHTAFLNSYASNIKILNNTFTNCKSAGIQIMGFQNCLIEGNTINGAPRGISSYYINTKGVYLSSTTKKEGGVKSKVSTKYKTPSKNQKIVIRNNTIRVAGGDVITPSENEGILVTGIKLTKKLKTSSCTLPKGNYYASGYTIENNKIDTVGHGVRLNNVRNTSISNNDISFTSSGAQKGNLYGIDIMNGSQNISIAGNTIRSVRTNGIYVISGSSVSQIANNTILNSGNYGIAIQGAKTSSISGNTITNSNVNGIYVLKKATTGPISGNTINGVKTGSGINVDAQSTSGNITRNTISNISINGIVIHKKSKSGSISGNIITNYGSRGIRLESGSKGTIGQNSIS